MGLYTDYQEPALGWVESWPAPLSGHARDPQQSILLYLWLVDLKAYVLNLIGWESSSSEPCGDLHLAPVLVVVQGVHRPHALAACRGQARRQAYAQAQGGMTWKGQMFSTK